MKFYAPLLNVAKIILKLKEESGFQLFLDIKGKEKETLEGKQI